MKNHFLLLFALLLLSSCLKNDVLDQPRSVNFLETPFYKERFDDFKFTVTDKVFYGEEISPNRVDTSYMTVIRYTIDPAYYDELLANWDYKLNLKVQSDITQRLRSGKYEYIDTIGRLKSGRFIPVTMKLEVTKVFKVMASTQYKQDIFIRP